MLFDVTDTFVSDALPSKPKNDMSCWFETFAVLLVVNVVSVNVKSVPTFEPAPSGLNEKPLEALLAMVVLETVSPVKLVTAVAILMPEFPLPDRVEPLMTTSVIAGVPLNAMPTPPLPTDATFANVR